MATTRYVTSRTCWSTPRGRCFGFLRLSTRAPAPSMSPTSRSISRPALWNSARGLSTVIKSRWRCTITRTLWIFRITGNQAHGILSKYPLISMSTRATAIIRQRQISHFTSSSDGRPSSTRSTWFCPQYWFHSFACLYSTCPPRPAKRWACWAVAGQFATLYWFRFVGFNRILLIRSRWELAFCCHWLCSCCSSRRFCHPHRWCCRWSPSTCCSPSSWTRCPFWWLWWLSIGTSVGRAHIVCPCGYAPSSCIICPPFCSWSVHERHVYAGWWRCRAWACQHIRTRRTARLPSYPSILAPSVANSPRWKWWSYPICIIPIARSIVRSTVAPSWAWATVVVVRVSLPIPYYFRRRPARPPRQSSL